MNMIGSKSVLEKVQELLEEIAQQNKEKYGHILDLTDFPEGTRIHLGNVKDEPEQNFVEWVYFDIIYGDITDANGDKIPVLNYYFKLSDNFEKDMNSKLNHLNERLDKATNKERETIKRLEALIDG